MVVCVHMCVMEEEGGCRAVEVVTPVLLAHLLRQGAKEKPDPRKRKRKDKKDPARGSDGGRDDAGSPAPGADGGAGVT